MKEPFYAFSPFRGDEQAYIRLQHSSSYFFHPDTMKMFRCRVCEGAYEVPNHDDHAFIVITNKGTIIDNRRVTNIAVAIPVPAQDGGRSGYRFEYLRDTTGESSDILKFDSPADARGFIAELQKDDSVFADTTWVGKKKVEDENEDSAEFLRFERLGESMARSGARPSIF